LAFSLEINIGFRHDFDLVTGMTSVLVELAAFNGDIDLVTGLLAMVVGLPFCRIGVIKGNVVVSFSWAVCKSLIG
jgi:hypothetical protein